MTVVNSRSQSAQENSGLRAAHAIRGEHKGRERSTINPIDTSKYIRHIDASSGARDQPIGSLLVIATAKMALGE